MRMAGAKACDVMPRQPESAAVFGDGLGDRYAAWDFAEKRQGQQVRLSSIGVRP
ncbi:hypothetical protein [Chromobacterium sphagni]|uniref:hypothetical protein n=1 Tax=Chromobacterium sphagni TaxID=1903179 RepID=UPI00138FFCA6|nr:hypothetical protein [Chromobacterium sphagni]